MAAVAAVGVAVSLTYLKVQESRGHRALRAVTAGAPTSQISEAEYSKEQAQRVLEHFNSLPWGRAFCANAFVSRYRRDVHRQCEATGLAASVGG